MMKLGFWLPVLFIFISCGDKNGMPEGILKPEKMQAILWDVIRADAFTTQFIKKDSSKNDVAENLKLQQEIFLIHHISKDQFYKSYEYYKANGNLMKEMIDSMINVAGRKKVLNTKPLMAE